MPLQRAKARATETDRSARLFAADCAQHVLPLFEEQHPDDPRPRRAIQAAKGYASGSIDSGELKVAEAAAWAAAEDTARAAASTAAWGAARAAAWATAEDAESTAAREAAMAAAWAIDEATELEDGADRVKHIEEDRYA